MSIIMNFGGGGNVDGKYVWAKYNLVDGSKGELISYITADKEEEYPKSGALGEYWYESDKDNIVEENILEGVDIFGINGNIQLKTASDFKIECLKQFSAYPQKSDGTYTEIIEVPNEYDMNKIAIYVLSYGSTTSSRLPHTINVNGNTISISVTPTYNYGEIFGSVWYIPNCSHVNQYYLENRPSVTLECNESESMVMSLSYFYGESCILVAEREDKMIPSGLGNSNWTTTISEIVF